MAKQLAPVKRRAAPLNACAQKPIPRRSDGQQTLTKHQAVKRQEYAETAERGVGLLQRFVSHSPDLVPQ